MCCDNLDLALAGLTSKMKEMVIVSDDGAETVDTVDTLDGGLCGGGRRNQKERGSSLTTHTQQQTPHQNSRLRVTHTDTSRN